jgi:hypothetical protein
MKKITCTPLDGIIQRTKEPSLPGRRRLPWPSRILVLIALSSRPYVVPGSASTALMKLSVMAPIEDDSSENPCFQCIMFISMIRATSEPASHRNCFDTQQRSFG